MLFDRECARAARERATSDLAAATKQPLCVHREAVPGGGPVVAYFRAGLSWRLYWRNESVVGPMTGPFGSLEDARKDAERVLADPTDEWEPLPT